MKIRNNYIPADGETYADRFAWEAQILDENGDILQTLAYLYGGLEYGAAAWADKDFSRDLSDVSAIRVYNYSVYQLGGSNNSTFLGSGKLSKPAIFPIDEIEISE